MGSGGERERNLGGQFVFGVGGGVTTKQQRPSGRIFFWFLRLRASRMVDIFHSCGVWSCFSKEKSRDWGNWDLICEKWVGGFRFFLLFFFGTSGRGLHFSVLASVTISLCGVWVGFLLLLAWNVMLVKERAVSVRACCGLGDGKWML